MTHCPLQQATFPVTDQPSKYEKAARMLTLHCAWRIEQVGTKEARNDISMIKYHGAEVLRKVVDRAMQTHGALGITDYTVLSHFYREERGSRIYDGPDEVHKLAVARRILSEHT